MKGFLLKISVKDVANQIRHFVTGMRCTGSYAVDCPDNHPPRMPTLIGNTFAASLHTDISPQRKEARPRLTLGIRFISTF
jgi:hypothetical protein